MHRMSELGGFEKILDFVLWSSEDFPTVSSTASKLAQVLYFGEFSEILQNEEYWSHHSPHIKRSGSTYEVKNEKQEQVS